VAETNRAEDDEANTSSWREAATLFSSLLEWCWPLNDKLNSSHCYLRVILRISSPNFALKLDAVYFDTISTVSINCQLTFNIYLSLLHWFIFIYAIWCDACFRWKTGRQAAS